MKTFYSRFFLFGWLILALSACQVAIPISLPAATSTKMCPATSPGMALWLNERDGYCLLYPDRYMLLETEGAPTGIVVDSPMNVSDPRLQIEVKEAQGQTAEEAAQALIDEFKTAGFDLVIATDLSVAGVPAVAVHQAPGQELNRRIFFVYDGRLYDIMVTHDDPTQAEAYTAMEALITAALESFTFIEASASAD